MCFKKLFQLTSLAYHIEVTLPNVPILDKQTAVFA